MRLALLVLVIATAATVLPGLAADDKPVQASAGQRVFEMRTYVANEGKLEALKARFRDHTTKLFEKHGMTNVGYWVPQDDKDGKANTLVYILAYPSRDAAKASWDAFRNDPDWKAAQAESEKDGKLVSKVISVYLDPTDFSSIH